MGFRRRGHDDKLCGGMQLTKSNRDFEQQLASWVVGEISRQHDHQWLNEEKGSGEPLTILLLESRNSSQPWHRRDKASYKRRACYFQRSSGCSGHYSSLSVGKQVNDWLRKNQSKPCPLWKTFCSCFSWPTFLNGIRNGAVSRLSPTLTFKLFNSVELFKVQQKHRCFRATDCLQTAGVRPQSYPER